MARDKTKKSLKVWLSAMSLMLVNCANPALAQTADTVAVPRRVDPRIDRYEPEYLKDFDIHSWAPAKMPLKVFITKTPIERGFDETLCKLIFKGFSQWVCAESSLRIERVDDYMKGDIVIERAAYGELGNGTGGRTLYDFSTDPRTGKQAIRRARVYMYSHSGVASDLDQYQQNVLFTLAMHEAGHAYGMDSHSSDADDMMFAKSTNMALSRHDLAAISHIYPPK